MPHVEGGSAAGPRSVLGLYLHIPFCAAICSYCNFNRGLFDEALKARYVRALAREIRSTGRGQPADTVFFGGGTPSLLQPAEIGVLLDACREAFDLAAGAEVTLEANPETVSEASLTGFRHAGVNRISFGVQSFRDEELRRLGRVHDAARAKSAFGEARAAGFENVSLDLMLWLPGQTRADLDVSLDALVDLAPEHASVYLLELYPNAPLREAMARSNWSLAPDDDAADMYLQTMERLEAAGYGQYEISNLAQPGRRCRHNLKYWLDGEWHGFGCGAHSTVGAVRWNNVNSATEYIGRVEGGLDIVAGRRPLSARERLEESLFMGLRLVEGVSLDRVRATHGVEVMAVYGCRLDPAIEAGLLVLEAGRLRLTRQGMLLANEVMTAFLEDGGTVK
jgi:oxygen-independent coproporphyrinogen-3 oxidase